MKTEIVSELLYNRSQSWYYTYIEKNDYGKLKVEIRRNAYDEQSYIHGFVFSPKDMQWNLLIDYPLSHFPTIERISYVHMNVQQEPFEIVRQKIVSELLTIIRE